MRGRSLRLASLWRITRRDGQVFRFAVHDRPLPFREEDFATYTYTPVQGIDPSSLEMPNGLEDLNLEVDGVTGTTITSDDLRAGLFRNAAVSEFVVNWRFPWAGAIVTTAYTMESLRFNGEDWKADMSGVGKRLTQRVGRRHSRRCDADLGDGRCAAPLGPFTFAAELAQSVSPSSPRQVFVLSGAPAGGLGDDFWTEGTVEWTGGSNAGVVSEVQKSTDGGGGSYTLTLYLPTPNDIQIGDAFTVIAGCNKTATICTSKFANLVNFQGYPTMPGSDKALQGP